MTKLKLNNFSRKFAEIIFSQYPEWEALAKSSDEPSDDQGCLIVEVPTPKGSTAKGPLVITTEGDEVSVFFDYYHSHFNWPPAYDETDPSINPLSFIADLLADRIAVVSWWRNDKWSGSGTAAADGQESYRPTDITRIRKRSWQGTLDADIEVK